MQETLIVVLIGLVTGLAGGMLGIGGAIVMIPALSTLLGPDQHRYQAAAMIVNFFVVVPAVVHHHQAGAIGRPTVAKIVPVALASVMLGVLASEAGAFAGGGERYLRALFGLFLLAVCVYELLRLGRDDMRDLAGSSPGRPVSWWWAIGIAGPAGFIAGLLGVGGGVVAVPLQRRLLRIPVRTAIANSAAMIIATSAVGAVLKNLAYLRDHSGSLEAVAMAASAIPTAMIGGWVGSHLTHRLPVRQIKGAFLLVLLFGGLRQLLSVTEDATPP